ncbi:hypothetical protein [Fluviicola sp.]|uniref:hypothetical protein n=1 Tax=Fluviicola sp. TaxID=1917219 RepID=UPI003D27A961
MKKSVTFITRNYPPSLNINGESVCDMVDFLQKKYPEIDCNIVFIDKNTEHGGKKREPVGNLIKIKNRFDGNFGPLRLFKMFYDGYILVKKARKLNSDLYIVTTSPPLLPFWAARGLGKNQKRALWALDLFPEMFKANGNVKETSTIYKWILKKSYSDHPEFVIALGPNQAKFITNNCYQQDIPISVLPCGAFKGEAPKEIPEWRDISKITIGYCGNVNDAHNPDFIRYMIDSILPEKQQLVLALYGGKSAPLIEYAQNKPGVILVKSVPREQLVYIDIHMVSLIPEFTHYAVPSKAVSAISMGKTIVFCGNVESDNWAMFHDAGWFIQDSDQMKTEIETFCRDITKEQISNKETIASTYSDSLTQMVQDSYHFVGKTITI